MFKPLYCVNCKSFCFFYNGTGTVEHVCKNCRQIQFLQNYAVRGGSIGPDFNEEAVRIVCKKCNHYIFSVYGLYEWSVVCSYCGAKDEMKIPEELSPEDRLKFIANAQQKRRPIKKLVTSNKILYNTNDK